MDDSSPPTQPFDSYQRAMAYEEAWRRGEQPRIEDYLGDGPDRDVQLLIELIHIDLHWRTQVGDALALEEYRRRFPELNPEQFQQIADYAKRFADYAAQLDRAAAKPSVQPGIPIGPYKLLQKLGEGGMGAVWHAEQLAPVRRHVALKLILPHLGSGQFLARFEAERQALALMDHPNIAKVFDAGTTESGMPYFVMELVKGIPFTKYCDDARLTIRERIELFVPICRAVQHAHTKGIIHRDLKPTNILVALYDGVPVPKIIDFGIAKATHQPLTEKTLVTNLGAVVGTPEYMAPEQAEVNALDIDTRADIYSLGMILYATLAGETPFNRKKAQGLALLELLRLIKETDPPPPSHKLSSINTLPDIAAKRRTEPQKLCKVVRGELDWIVMKALEKERSRRYTTADLFAADLEHYLADEPVAARPQSVGYRLRKAVRRHRGAAVAAALLLVSLVGGLVATATQAYRATRAESKIQAAFENETNERKRANDAAEKAEEQALAAKKSDAQSRELLAYANLQLSQSYFRDGLVSLARTTLASIPDDHRGWSHNYLRRCFQGGDMTLRGHTGVIRRVGFSPDGKRLASSGDEIKVWNALTGQEELTLRERGDDVSFSPDGTRLVSGYRNLIKFWDARTGQEQLTLRDPSGPISCVAFSRDGTQIAYGNIDRAGTIQVADARTGHRKMSLRGHTGPVYSVAFSPDGTRIVTGSIDKTLKTWDAQTGQEEFTLRGHDDAVWSVTFSPDGTRLASGGDVIKVWNAKTGCEEHTLRGQSNHVWSVAFSPDGARLASGDDGNLIKLWDVRTGRQELTLSGHSDHVWSVSFSPDGTRLASGSHDRTIKFWDSRNGQTNQSFPGHLSWVGSLEFSPDGLRLASGSGDKTIKVWNAQFGSEEMTLRGHSDFVKSVNFSPDGTRLASGSGDNTIKVWNAHTGREELTLFGHNGDCNVAFSPDGMQLASGSGENTIKLWNARTGREEITLRGHRHTVISVIFSPDGMRLASGSGDKTIKVWNARTASEEFTLSGHTHKVNCVAFGPDCSRLASCSDDQTIMIWNTQTGRSQLTLKGHTNSVRTVAFSPDGTRLASGSWDKTIKVWDVRTGRIELTLPVHGTVAQVAFSPDGSRLAWARGDGLIQTSSAKACQQDVTLRGHLGQVLNVCFSPDGTHTLTYSKDETARLWDSSTGHEVHQWPIALPVNALIVEPPSIGFDRGGRFIRIKGRDEFVYDAQSGKLVGDKRSVEFPENAKPFMHPNGKIFAYIEGNEVHLIDLTIPEWEMEYRLAKARPDPWWHGEQFNKAVANKDQFAATFHYRQLRSILPVDLMPSVPIVMPLGGLW